MQPCARDDEPGSQRLMITWYGLSLRAHIALAYHFRPAGGFGAHELGEALERHRLVGSALAYQTFLKRRLCGNTTDIGMEPSDDVLRQSGRTEERIPARHVITGHAGCGKRRKIRPGRCPVRCRYREGARSS